MTTKQIANLQAKKQRLDIFFDEFLALFGDRQHNGTLHIEAQELYNKKFDEYVKLTQQLRLCERKK